MRQTDTPRAQRVPSSFCVQALLQCAQRQAHRGRAGKTRRVFLNLTIHESAVRLCVPPFIYFLIQKWYNFFVPRTKRSSQTLEIVQEETKEFTKPKRNYKKYFWLLLPLAGLSIGAYLVFARQQSPNFAPAYTVSLMDVKQTVVATGILTSQTNLNLSFKTSGIISKINVKVGDKVKQGQVLASLDAKDAQAQLAVAYAGVSSAQVALNNAKNNYNIVVKQQQTLVDNAYATMLSSNLSAINESSTNNVSITVSGTYTGKEEGQYILQPYLTGNGYYVNVSGLETQTTLVSANLPIALGTRGLYITFSSSNLNLSGNWTIDIPNKQSSAYLANSNAYQAALQTQDQQVTTAKGAIDTALAALETAKAQLLVAQNQYSNNLIEAPIPGLVTSVDGKLGEQVGALSKVVSLLDSSSLHVEALIPESSINQVKVGQDITMTYDAFGPNEYFAGKVSSIDPASTVSSGVINFRVISSLPDDPRIKPGMTVNMNIIISQRQNVLAVPNRLITSTNGKKLVKVIRNSRLQEVNITTGLEGDNYAEVTSGLSVGDVLATEIK